MLPEAAAYSGETDAADATAEGFSLNLVDYVVKARAGWERAVAAFAQVTATYPYDLIVGDETYEVASALHLHPELKKAPFVLIYDFVGLDATSWRLRERRLAHRWNRGWCGGWKGRPPREDLILFVGEPEDVPDRRFGLGLPNRREYARRYYDFVGFILSFDPAAYADRRQVRSALGYDERPLVLCAVGGTGVGGDLLRLCAAAYPHLQARVNDVRLVLICGPRVEPTVVDAPPGVEVRGYVQRLYEHLAASDVAVVQGGGTTTLELTALRRPFLFFPVEGQFEQETVVADRLARQQAGRRMSYSRTTPQSLAAAIIDELGSEATWPPIRTDGATRAAEAITTLWHTGRSTHTRA